MLRPRSSRARYSHHRIVALVLRRASGGDLVPRWVVDEGGRAIALVVGRVVMDVESVGGIVQMIAWAGLAEGEGSGAADVARRVRTLRVTKEVEAVIVVEGAPGELPVLMRVTDIALSKLDLCALPRILLELVDGEAELRLVLNDVTNRHVRIALALCTDRIVARPEGEVARCLGWHEGCGECREVHGALRLGPQLGERVGLELCRGPNEYSR